MERPVEEWEKQFERMGAKVKVGKLSESRPGFFSRRRVRNGDQVPATLDVHGAEFDIQLRPDAQAEVLDCDPKDRHLLLRILQNKQDYRYLCGHDETQWFVAAVPGRPSNLAAAKEALKPQAVREHKSQLTRRGRKQTGKRNKVKRQGEWFFVPAPDVNPPQEEWLHNEPIRRGRSKPHVCEWLWRNGGTQVWVNDDYPNGVTLSERVEIDQRTAAEGKTLYWRNMTRDARVWAKGRITHPDHHVLKLNDWHEVLLSRESDAPHSQHLAFLD